MVFVDTAEYLFAVLGGALLGVAASLNYVLRGKVTGMSGVLYGVVSLNKEQLPEKLTIIGGMLLISGVFFDIFGYSQGQSSTGMIPFGSRQNIVAGTSFVGFALAGLLVGFGTKLSNGCTSGHGLCGLARLSTRSLVAVCTFLFTSIGVGTLGYYFTLGALNDQKLNPIVEINNLASANTFLAIGVLLPVVSYLIARTNPNFDLTNFFKQQAVLFSVGIIFGAGLMVSGMTRRIKIMRFLQIGADWDPSLLFVLATGVTVNLIAFNYASRVRKQPVLNSGPFPPVMTVIDCKLVIGAALFGVGWGIGYLCPGPFMMLFSVFSLQVQVVWGISCILGMFLANWLGQVIDRKKVENSEPQQVHPSNPEIESASKPKQEVQPQESSVAVIDKAIEPDRFERLPLELFDGSESNKSEV